MSVTIKPLVWTLVSPLGKMWHANSVVGVFTITAGRWMHTSHAGNGPLLTCRDDDTAKAAAQAHYETLIRSTLEP